MIENIPFLIIDDDPNIITLLNNVISKVFPKSPVHTETEGESGWNYIKKNNQPMIVICDIYMPGLSGIQILKNVRSDESFKNIYFIIITGLTDKDLSLKALQQGADDFFNKPFTLDQLIAKLRSATRIINLQIQMLDENQRLKDMNQELEKDIQKMKDIILKFQELRIPESKDILQRVADAAVWIAKSLNETDTKEIRNIEHAANLAFVGRLFLPDKSVNDPVMLRGHTKNKTMEQVPIFARDMIKEIKGFDEVANILYHVYENFDGTGIPENIQSWKIPLGSRILRVLLDYEEFNAQTKNINKAIEMLEHEAHRLYDFKIITFLDQYHATLGIGLIHGKEEPLLVKDLSEGMIITRNIITNSGLKLVSSGTLLNEDKIDKIRNITKSDPIIGKVFIRAKK